MNVLRKQRGIYAGNTMVFLSPCLFTASWGRHAYFQSMALVFIVLSLVVYVMTMIIRLRIELGLSFEIIWRPVHDYEMINFYIQQWELFMYLHVSDLVHCNAMYNDKCLYYLVAWKFTSTFWRILSSQIKDRYSPISRIFIDWENAAPMANWEWRLDEIGRYYS